MNKFFSLVALAALVPAVTASAQQSDAVYRYDGEGFYLSLNAQSDVRIGSTGEMRFVTEDPDDDEPKVEVTIYKVPTVNGYSNVREDVEDYDFFIKTDSTELMAEGRRTARKFLFSLSRTSRTGASLSVYVADLKERDGRKKVYLDIPTSVVNEICEAQRKTWNNTLY